MSTQALRVQVTQGAVVKVVAAANVGPPGRGVPAGGGAGQVLAKVSDDDFDDAWVDPSGGGGVPDGGSAGQTLLKQSSTDGDVAWTTLHLANIADAGTAAGHAATDFDAAGAASGLVGSEASTRAGADSALSSAISAEATTRAAADTTNANAIAAEASARASADTANANAITAETSRATAAEGTNATAISTETARAAAAEALLAPKASPTFTGTTTAPEFTASGLTGATAATRYVGATSGAAPTSGTFAVGDFVIGQTGKVWVCTVAGTPGTWVSAGATSPVADGTYGASNLVPAITMASGVISSIGTNALTVPRFGGLRAFTHSYGSVGGFGSSLVGNFSGFVRRLAAALNVPSTEIDLWYHGGLLAGCPHCAVSARVSGSAACSGTTTRTTRMALRGTRRRSRAAKRRRSST